MTAWERMVAHWLIIGHTLGLNLIARFGYTTTWTIFIGMLAVAMAMLVMLSSLRRFSTVS